MVTVKVYEDPPSRVAVTGQMQYAVQNDYEKLDNKPRINDVELVGNKSTDEIGIHTMTNEEIDRLVDTVFKE